MHTGNAVVGVDAARYRIDRPARLGSAVVSVLIERIAGGEFPPGSVLPPEPELAAEFAVSRTVVREALKGIEDKGIANIQQGKGTTVRDVEYWDLLDEQVLGAVLDHDASLSVLADLVALRRAVESELGALAAGRITDEELDELRETMAGMDAACDDPAQYGRLEYRFHGLIMAASGNLVGRAVMAAVGKHMQLGTRWIDAVPNAPKVDVAHPGHREIFHQISRRNPTGTARAMRDHLTTCWAWVEEERDRTARAADHQPRTTSSRAATAR